MDRIKRIRYLSPMRAAKVQPSLRIQAVSPEPPLLDHTSSESWGTSRQKARPLAHLNGWACAVKMCHEGMLEDTNSPDGAQIVLADRLWHGDAWDLGIFFPGLTSLGKWQTDKDSSIKVSSSLVIDFYTYSIQQLNTLQNSKAIGYPINHKTRSLKM